MADHFAAFSFVDRITAIRAGHARARARSPCRATSPSFPSCLVAEAVGQLAAWVAMAHIGISRPAGGGARQRDAVPRDVAPGETLELAVEIEDCDDEAVAYRRLGGASTAGA